MSLWSFLSLCSRRSFNKQEKAGLFQKKDLTLLSKPSLLLTPIQDFNTINESHHLIGRTQSQVESDRKRKIIAREAKVHERIEQSRLGKQQKKGYQRTIQYCTIGANSQWPIQRYPMQSSSNQQKSIIAKALGSSKLYISCRRSWQLDASCPYMMQPPTPVQITPPEGIKAHASDTRASGTIWSGP